VLPVGSGAGALATQAGASSFEPEADVGGPLPALASGRTTRVALRNVDDELVVEIDGSVALRRPYVTRGIDPDVDPAARDDGTRVVAGASGGAVELEDVGLWRDIHYLSDGNMSHSARSASYTVPDGEFMVLGDNTQNSWDCRQWVSATMALTDGRTITGNYFSAFGNSADSNPDHFGPDVHFRNIYGQDYVYPRSAERGEYVTNDVHSVPERMLLGKALAVFWPLPPFEVRGLVKLYGRRKVVDGVSFEVDAAEIVGLLGPNGAGKTTSFRSTIGMITPDEGEVWFDGQDVTRMPMYLRARLGMGYLSQEPSIFRQMTVEENVLAVLEMRSMARGARLRRAAELLEELGLSHLARQRADTLSGGERRRLEISRTLAIEPTLILLDEPFSGIDPKVVGELQRLLEGLRARGIGILITDHAWRETLQSTDRAYVIVEGRVLRHGPPEELKNDPEVRLRYLGAEASVDGN
jgi:lipopolysaccharide export system ATP-binding protein